MIRLTPYGKDVVLKVFIVVLILGVLCIVVDNTVFKVLAGVTAVLAWLFTLYFFRDPERTLPNSYMEGSIISPADGKVVLIQDITNAQDNLFKAGEALRQVSIFLSPLNVHVNRIPLSGAVSFFSYVKGDYLVAFDHKSSERNERTEIGITGKSENEKVLFKQIAGYVARRIVCDIDKGSQVKAGERFGMIKFGSRVDIILKPEYKITVKVGEKVVAGESIIAEL